MNTKKIIASIVLVIFIILLVIVFIAFSVQHTHDKVVYISRINVLKSLYRNIVTAEGSQSNREKVILAFKTGKIHIPTHTSLSQIYISCEAPSHSNSVVAGILTNDSYIIINSNEKVSTLKKDKMLKWQKVSLKDVLASSIKQNASNSEPSPTPNQNNDSPK